MERTGERELRWVTGSRERLREFPEPVRWGIGRALYKAQVGKLHEAAAAMRGRLGGTVEVAADHSGDTFRLYYTLKCPGYVHVLYCHKKKSKRGAALSKRDGDLLFRRFRDAVTACREGRRGLS